MPLRIPVSLWALTETQTLTDEAQPAPVCETPPLSPRSVSHYICFALACCHAGKNTQFFCSLFQPIRKWIGGSFLFPVFPRQYGHGPSSPVRFPKFMRSSRKPKSVITITIISLLPLSLSLLYKYVADFQLWVISQSDLMPKDKTLMKTMWCKGYTDITGRRALWGSDWHGVWALLGNKTE